MAVSSLEAGKQIHDSRDGGHLEVWGSPQPLKETALRIPEHDNVYACCLQLPIHSTHQLRGSPSLHSDRIKHVSEAQQC